MFAQHPGNQGKEGGVDRAKERKRRKENHTAAKSSWAFSILWVINMGKINIATIIIIAFFLLVCDQSLRVQNTPVISENIRNLPPNVKHDY